MRKLFDEMRRRGVLQMLGVYVVGAWLVLQVADLAFESWGVAAPALRYVWIGAFVLFPAALLFSWRYDVTASGIARTPAEPGDGQQALRRSDRVILGGLSAYVLAAATVLTVQISAVPANSQTSTPAQQDIDPNAIAVLPFATSGAAEDTAFFADGIHDELLTTLANISSLKVISRTSVMQYRDAQLNMRRIAGELGARNILEGRVQRAGDSVRINVQLINAADDEHIWAEIYDRALSIGNIFDIQSEMAQTIAAQLAREISPDERRRIDRQPTDNLEAFNAYIKGKHQFNRSSFQALWNSEALFRQAIELDPEFARAHFALAFTYVMLAYTGAITVEEAVSKGSDIVRRGLELDPRSGYGQAVLASYEFAWGEDGFDDTFQYALQLSPNSVDVMDIYGSFLRIQNRNEEALAMTQRALELDPMSPTLYHDLGRSYVALGRFSEAHQAFERIAQLDPENPYAPHGAALATILGGMLAEATHWSDATIATDPQDPENWATAVFIFAAIGDMERAQLRLDEALKYGPDAPLALAAQVYMLTLQQKHAEALSIARAALAMGVEDRWRSHQLLLRILRDEAIRSGNYQEALVWYEKLNPAIFAGQPQLDGGNIAKAADGAQLLLMAGRHAEAERILEEVVARYDELYVLGASNYPLTIADVDALILLKRESEALDALQRHVDDRWRLLWRWCTEENPAHNSLRDNPRYQQLVEAIREDLAQQVRESRQ